jgi:hypothetical protein
MPVRGKKVNGRPAHDTTASGMTARDKKAHDNWKHRKLSSQLF